MSARRAPGSPKSHGSRTWPLVPYAHGVWLSRHVTGATARLFDREGHLSLALRFGEIVDDMLARAGTI